MPRSTRSSVVKGTMILIVGNIIVKIIGAFFKLPLANIIGADGMGLYNSSFTVYDIFLVLSTSGYTLAISKMVSTCYAYGKDGEALEILRITRNLLAVIGLAFSVIMFAGARIFAGLIGNTRSFYCILMLSPAVLLVSIMCSYRGYYQGTNDMIPTTVSQVIEAVVRLVVGLAASAYLKYKGFGMEIVAAGALAGITLGEFSSTFTLAMLHKFKRRGKRIRRINAARPARILKTLFATSIPIGISGIIISVINIIDNSILMHRLQYIGCSEQEANTLNGAFNMAYTVFSLPITVVMAVTTSVFPILSYAHACGNKVRIQKLVMASLRIIMIVSTATAAIFLSLSKPIVSIIYFGQPRDATIAAPLLILMSPAAILISIAVMTGRVLQAVDKLLVPSRSTIIGGSICLVINWYLIGNPKIGIYGVPIGICICYFIVSALNIIEIKRCGIKLKLKEIMMKPLLPSLVLAISLAVVYYMTYRTLGLIYATVLSLAVGLILYLTVLFTTKTIEKEDLDMIPGGKKIIKILEKLHFIDTKGTIKTY